ncbi:hypothetical protein VTO73DRAFT_13962 [Trametes versicolor]
MASIASLEQLVRDTCVAYAPALAREVDRAVIGLEEMRESGSHGPDDWRAALDDTLKLMGDYFAITLHGREMVPLLEWVEMLLCLAHDPDGLWLYFQERFLLAKCRATRLYYLRALHRVEAALMQARVVRGVASRSDAPLGLASAVTRLEAQLHELRTVHEELKEELQLVGDVAPDAVTEVR